MFNLQVFKGGSSASLWTYGLENYLLHLQTSCVLHGIIQAGCFCLSPFAIIHIFSKLGPMMEMVRGVILDLYWLGTRWSVKYNVSSITFQKYGIYFDYVKQKRLFIH